jgi:hypothetical protein
MSTGGILQTVEQNQEKAHRVLAPRALLRHLARRVGDIKGLDAIASWVSW